MNTMPKLKIEMLPVDALNEYEGNARQHGETDIAAIKASIEKFGFNDPIGIWGENIIVEGHGRLMAAKDLGMTEVPVIRLDHLTEEERRAYGLAHNKTAELSMWNFEKLDLELAGIKSFDMTQYGFPEIEQEPDPEDIIEDTPPENAEHVCERGMIFVLGNHRLMCGDSTSAEDMDKLMAGEKPVMVFTDPPYGVSIGDKNKALTDNGYGGGITQNIIGDTLKKNDLYEILVKAFANLKAHTADDCSYYVTAPQGGDLGLMMQQMMIDSGLAVRHILMWVKNAATFSMGRLDYDYRHEPIFYTWTKSHKFYGGYNTSVIDDTQDIDKMSKAELKEMLRAIKEREDTSVIYVDRPAKANLHPTMKPVKLVARLMFNSSRKGDIVADIFGGSGTTMIAAEQLGRRCMMMELDPHYCDVIIARWEAFTGQKAERIA